MIDCSALGDEHWKRFLGRSETSEVVLDDRIGKVCLKVEMRPVSQYRENKYECHDMKKWSTICVTKGGELFDGLGCVRSWGCE